MQPGKFKKREQDMHDTQFDKNLDVAQLHHCIQPNIKLVTEIWHLKDEKMLKMKSKSAEG